MLANPFSPISAKASTWLNDTPKFKAYILGTIAKEFPEVPQILTNDSDYKENGTDTLTPDIDLSSLLSGDITFEYMPMMKNGDPLRFLFDYAGMTQYKSIDKPPSGWLEKRARAESDEFEGN